MGPVRAAFTDLDLVSAPPAARPPSAPAQPTMVMMAPGDPILVPIFRGLPPGRAWQLQHVGLAGASGVPGRVQADPERGAARLRTPHRQAAVGAVRVDAGCPGVRHRAPGVCFSVWLPWGNVEYENRAAALRQHTADGLWHPIRYRGPSDFAAWKRSWMVFEAAMLSLGAASPAALRSYREGIELLNTDWPGHWHRIAMADLQVRTAQWDRLREDLLERPVTAGGMLETEGWDRIIQLSAYEGMTMSGPLAKWWERNCW